MWTRKHLWKNKFKVLVRKVPRRQQSTLAGLVVTWVNYFNNLEAAKGMLPF